jgi:hypothetical protein
MASAGGLMSYAPDLADGFSCLPLDGRALHSGNRAVRALSRIRSLAASTIDMSESSFRKRHASEREPGRCTLLDIAGAFHFAFGGRLRGGKRRIDR